MALGLGMLEAGVGAAQALTGLIGMGKAKRKANAAVDAMATYRPSQEIAGVYESAKMRSTKGLGGAARQSAVQGIEAGAQAAMNAAQDRKAALGMIGSVQAQRQKGALQLGAQEEAAQTQNQGALTQAAGLQAREKEKAFKSEQEKQSLKTNIALQDVAAKRSAISQGLGAVAGGLGMGAMMGEKNPLSGLFKKKGSPVNMGLMQQDFATTLSQGKNLLNQDLIPSSEDESGFSPYSGALLGYRPRK